MTGVEKRMLYRYVRGDGGMTVSPVKPPEGTVYGMRIRLIAGEGMLLTDGERIAPCVDVEDDSGWHEIPAPTEDEGSEDGNDI